MPTHQDFSQAADRRILQAKQSKATSLDLSNLNLRVIPEAVFHLVNLQSLDLHINQITAIPDALRQLVNLRSLHLTDNKITAIPEALGQLANLQMLYLSGNQISTIPEWIGQLTNLEELYLAANNITDISDAVGQLANLRILYLGDNQIATIPDTVGQLTKLQTLYLESNQITAIPEALAQLPKLTALYLHENPGLGIPEEILGPRHNDVEYGDERPKAPREILNYSKSLADAQPLNEAKLIMVGQGAVGKTSLVQALTTGEFNPHEKTTEGIKINDWSCTIAGNNEVKLHIWDFGGQEMMHATHQFFLTARSLYLLVLNRRTGGCDREADYWFRLIRAFGGKDAPVIVVLNKHKSEPFDVNRGGWLEKYADNIRGFVETDCEDAQSITRLKQTIQEQLLAMKSLQASFPRRWFAIKDELSQMAAEYVTFEDYRDLCRKHGEGDPAQQTSLAGFLHDLGIALNYKDDARLRFGYVLKPEWVTEGIYALLHAFVTSKGLFTPIEAEKVLAPKKYPPEAVEFILGLMEKFELSFPLGDGKKRILIPQLLDDQQPEEARSFKAAECLNFGYQYSIVPEGLLPRFIVRTHHLSQPATRWKSGVILHGVVLHHDESGCRALVKADTTEGLVHIYIDGPETARPQLLAIIRHNFSVIHADYEFKPLELVYAQGVPEKAHRRDELEAFLLSGTVTIPVLHNNKVTTQSISSLIEPVQSSLQPLKLFLSYSHKDEKYVNELRKDLKLMERNGLIRTWYDRALRAGEKWEESILQELKTADIMVCQLSRDFLASDFCVLTELDTAIKRKIAGEAELVAYVLKECGWKEVSKLKQFQVLPQDAKPLSDWNGKDKYWRAVAEGIKRVLEKMQKDPRRHSRQSQSFTAEIT
jgi:internalin A